MNAITIFLAFQFLRLLLNIEGNVVKKEDNLPIMAKGIYLTEHIYFALFSEINPMEFIAQHNLYMQICIPLNKNNSVNL